MQALAGLGLLSLVVIAVLKVLSAGMDSTLAERYTHREPGNWLREIVEAQRRFKADDRDGNGKVDYWRADVAGLHEMVPIDASIAKADDRAPSVMAGDTFLMPKEGYVFRSLRFAGETVLASDGFAVLCYPASGSPHRFMYAVREDGHVWRKAAVAGGVDVFPADPAVEGWVRTP